MKKITKRLIACILSALLLVTSLPFSALANNTKATPADYDSLIDAIHAYEGKMDGTVFTNMKAAYEKYITAKEVAYAYYYGENDTINVKGAADNLAAATAAMTAWTGTTVDSQQFSYGGAVPSQYSKNVIYASTPQSFGGSSVEGSIFRFLLPQKAVLLYNETDIIIPVMCAYHNNGGAGGNDRAALGLYLNNNERDSQNENTSLKLTGVWMGRHETSISGGPASASAYSWQEAYNQYNEAYGGDSHPTTIPGYDQASTAATTADIRGEKQNTNNGDKWWQYINTIKYHHPVDSFSNGYRTVGFGMTGRSMRWTTVWSTSTNDWHYYSYGNNNNFSGTYYVIDYSGVDAAMTKASAALNLDGKNYLHGELNDILAAYEVLQENPAAQGYTDSNLAEKVSSVASAIQTNVATLNNAKVPAEMDNGYISLTNALVESKPVYDANNAGGIYTDESFSAFKTAYDASKAEAAIVADNHFTTATTGDALDAAFKALNRKVTPSGQSGDTEYTFDSETGTVTITGPGTMADYESGADSPFGENSDVTSVVIDPSVTHIGAHAFDGASELTTVTVPASATYGEGAFDNCPKLRTVIITGGAVNDSSAPNAPWTQPSVNTVKLGVDEDDYSITAVDDKVFEDNRNIAVYIYNPVCNIDDTTNNTFGTNPTIYGYAPSTAYDYATKFNYSFVSLGHEHVWNDGTVVPATCTVSGYTLYTCIFCEATKTGNYQSALGHDWNDGEEVPPTCTERGYTLQTCQRQGCGETKKSNYKKATGHDFTGAKSPQYPSGAPRSDTATYKHSIACTKCTATKEEYCSFKVDGTDGSGNIIFKCSVCGGTYLYENTAGTGKNTVFYFSADNDLIATEEVSTNAKPTNVPEITSQQVGHEYYWTLDGARVDPSTVIINQPTIFKVADTLVQYNVKYVDVNGYEISTEKVNHGSTPSSIPSLPSEAINLNDDGHQVYAWDSDPSAAVITADATFTQTLITKAHDFEDTILSEPTCGTDGTRERYCPTCGYRITNDIIPATKNHNITETVITQPTCTQKGKTNRACTNCDFSETVDAPNALGHDFSNNAQYCRRGCGTKNPNYVAPVTPISNLDTSGGKKVNEAQVDKFVTNLPNDNDAAGTKFSFMLGKQKKVTKNAISLTWKKPANAAYFVVYGNKCGAGNKYKKITKVWSTTFTQSGLAKNTYYKYMIAAFDRSGNLLGTTNTIHVATLGGKNGNPKAVKTKVKKLKLKKGKSKKIGAKQVAPKKQKVKKHRPIRYESTNTRVATVSSSGKVKATGKGTCYVYAYAQNGVYKAVKVTVK